MFVLDPIHPSYSAVIGAIAIRPNMTVAEVHAYINKTVRTPVSIAHVYRIITRMTDAQIIVRSRGKLSLNLMWVSYIASFAERAKKLIDHSMDMDLLEGEKRRYSADCLLDMETIWNHILVMLYRRKAEKTIDKYYSHAWWQIGKNAEEISFYEELAKRGIRARWLFGNDTFLDRLGADRVNAVFKGVSKNETPFPKEGYCLNVYGDCIIECVLPDTLSKHFAFLFKNVRSQADFDEQVFLDLFAHKGKCVITVWRNTKQAQKLREQIASFFYITSPAASACG